MSIYNRIYSIVEVFLVEATNDGMDPEYIAQYIPEAIMEDFEVINKNTEGDDLKNFCKKVILNEFSKEKSMECRAKYVTDKIMENFDFSW
ncbi:hypothetical protein [Gluconobacter potus]|uniref:hypothetical protein n=1 Tax=Gluconobacter potus TaxID=2724927 RepID=UPI0039EC766D